MIGSALWPQVQILPIALSVLFCLMLESNGYYWFSNQHLILIFENILRIILHSH